MMNVDLIYTNNTWHIPEGTVMNTMYQFPIYQIQYMVDIDRWDSTQFDFPNFHLTFRCLLFLAPF